MQLRLDSFYCAELLQSAAKKFNVHNESRSMVRWCMEMDFWVFTCSIVASEIPLDSVYVLSLKVILSDFGLYLEACIANRYERKVVTERT